MTISLEDLKAEILSATAELNELAEMGARPLWSSLTARMEQIYANLGGNPVDLDPRLAEPVVKT